MKKVLIATAFVALALPGFAAEPAGKVLADEGKVFANHHGTVVRKALKKGEKIDKHNHEGEDIIFNVMQGAIKITLNDSEEHELKAGDTLVTAKTSSPAKQLMTRWSSSPSSKNEPGKHH